MVIASIAGLVMVFLVPPFQVPDEVEHYVRSASIDNGVLCDEGSVEIEQENLDLVEKMDPTSIAFQGEKRFDEHLITEYAESRDRSLTKYESALCRVFPITYLPSSLGVTVSGLFTGNELLSFYAGRWINLFVAICLVSLAIKLSPIGKKIIAWLALLPMSVFMFSSFNYDALFIPVLILFVALVFNLLRRKERPSINDVLGLFALSAIIINIKPPYAPVLLLPTLLLFRNGSESKRNAALVVGVFVIAVLSFLLASRLSPSLEYPDWTDPSGQLHFVLTHIPAYAVVIARTIYRNIVYYATGASLSRLSQLVTSSEW